MQLHCRSWRNWGAEVHAILHVKGKIAIYIARELGNSRNATGHKFWARGYFVSSVGRDEEVICRYIQHQEKEDQKLEQVNLFRA